MHFHLLLSTLLMAPSQAGAIEFAPPSLVPTGASFLPAGIAAADLDGDGLLEIITADSFAGTVTVLHNQGNGSFVPTARIACGSRGAQWVCHPPAPASTETVIRGADDLCARVAPLDGRTELVGD